MAHVLSSITNFIRSLFNRFSTAATSPVPKVSTRGSTVARQYRMNYFDPGENSNKVWIGMAYSDGRFETRFGRVRDEANLVSKEKKFPSQAAAEAELERKRREKLRKGYKDTVVLDNHVEVAVRKDKKTLLSKIAAAQIAGASDSVTAELIKYLADVNIHHITHSTSIKYNAKTGAFSTPLGVLTPEAISDARDLLAEIKRLDGLQRKQHKKRASCVRDYFQLVPKDFGTKIPPSEELIATEEKFQEEVSILDALESAISGIDQPTEGSSSNANSPKYPTTRTKAAICFAMSAISTSKRATQNIIRPPLLCK